MDCWGITALQSDPGLNAISYIREKLLRDGRLDLDTVIDTLRRKSWNRPPKASEGPSHTSLMAVAELIVLYLNKDAASLDYVGQWSEKHRKFASIHSFTASKESLTYLRDYLSESLRNAKENAKCKAEHGEMWGGWFEEKNWIGWQEHMEALVSCLNTLLAAEGNLLELVPQQQIKRDDRDKEGKKLFLPEDGMTVTFSVIMLSGRNKKGQLLQDEIYTGGCITSRFIPNLPDFKEFAKKCCSYQLIEVDNYAYELEGDSWHTRKAVKWEIRQIVGENFPYNYDGDILHAVSHDGPDQFYIKNGVMYEGSQDKIFTDLSMKH